MDIDVASLERGDVLALTASRIEAVPFLCAEVWDERESRAGQLDTPRKCVLSPVTLAHTLSDPDASLLRQQSARMRCCNA